MAVGALVIMQPVLVLQLLAIVAGGALAYVGSAELIRLVAEAVAAQQPGAADGEELGIEQQLEAGFRGLLIDPHYGVQTPRGVYTDLNRDNTSREKIEESLGTDGVAAAERLRARIGYDGGGETEIFFCHGFCEVGAIEAVDGFREIRDFLVANPSEVVLVSIEDATSPAPRPTNARRVNQRDFLLERIRRCTRLRGKQPNIIAVDFFREGDTLEVVDELNAEG